MDSAKSTEETRLLEDLPPAINFRDVAEIAPSQLKPGVLFRSSEMFKFELLTQYGIKTIVDMRKGTPNAETHPVYVALDSDKSTHDGPLNIFPFDMIKTSVKLTILYRMPRRIWLSLIKGWFNGKSPQEIMSPAVGDPSCLGFKEFYKILLDKAGDVIAEILRVFANPANYPVMFHCTHGKDRTGIVCCLLGLIAGVPRDAICQDYVLSGEQLSAAKSMYKLPIEDHLMDDAVIQATYDVISGMITYLDTFYGGAVGYATSIGLSPVELEAIRCNITI